MPSISLGAKDEEEEEAARQTQQEDEEAEEAEEAEEIDEADEAPQPPRVPHLRVLFSDIEGVLNPRPDPRLLAVQAAQCVLLRRLLQRTGATLVLTSSWRRHRAYVAEVLKNFGVFDTKEELKELEVTPFNADEARRDLEILQWLNSRRGEVAAWAVLDARDLLTFASAPRLEGHVIQVDPEKGLQPQHLEAAVGVLGEAAGPPAPPAPESAQAAQAALRSTPPSQPSSSSALFEHLAMDEGLASKMQGALAMLSSLGEDPSGAFRPPQRPKAKGCPDSEFDALLLQAKGKFGQ